MPSASCLVYVIISVVIYMFFAHSGPIDTADSKLSGYHSFRNTVMKNEHSLDYSNRTNDEGDTVVYLLLVMYCIISLFSLPVITPGHFFPCPRPWHI